MFLISDYSEHIISLIQSAISFHGLTCNELMNCDSAIAWSHNINCPEYQTEAEVFQGNLRNLLFSFEGVWNWLSNINRVYSQDQDQKLDLFKELLPLLAGFDVAVLAFAGPFFAQVKEQIQKKLSRFLSKKELSSANDEEKGFKNFMYHYARHLIITSVVLVCSPVIKEFWLFISIILFIFSCYLIIKLLDWMTDMIFHENRKYDVDSIIKRLDQLMDLGVNT